MNYLRLSVCGRAVEFWDADGVLRGTVPIAGSIHQAIELGEALCRERTGTNPEVADELRAKMRASDALLTRLAFGTDYR